MRRGLALFATLAALASALAVAARSAPPAADLAPWRALAHSPAGTRLLAIARASLEGRDETTAPDAERTTPAPDAAGASPPEAEPWPPPPAALYVTLVRGTATRACVAHEPPRGADVAEAVRALAPQALTGDRRRAPVRRDELDGLRVVLGFASAAEPIADPMQVDPGRVGLLVETDRGRVAFLPGEARTVDWALREARRIGVLSGPQSAARFYRFDVVTLSEAAAPASRREASDAAP